MSFGIPNVTGYAPLYGEAPNAYNIMYSRGSVTARIAQLISHQGFKNQRAIMRALNGVAPGANATATTVRPTGGAGDGKNGGLITMETQTTVNRNTTPADVTAINAQIYDYYPGTAIVYPVDPSGNGGGGKAGR